MTNQIPPELLHKWREEAPRLAELATNFIADKAAEWAADQQLIRVIDWLRADGPHEGVRNELSIAQLDSLVTELWAAMRPKPPSLKQQATKELLHLRMEMKRHGLDVPTTPALARVLESVPDTDS